MSRNWKQTFAIAIALTAMAGAAGAKGTDEELARELSINLEKLAFIADSFFDGVDGESAAVEEAMALVDWFVSAAQEIEQRFEKRGDSEDSSRAKDLAEAADGAQEQLREYAKDKSSPKLCEQALREVLETGGVVVKILGSEASQ